MGELKQINRKKKILIKIPKLLSIFLKKKNFKGDWLPLLGWQSCCPHNVMVESGYPSSRWASLTMGGQPAAEHIGSPWPFWPKSSRPSLDLSAHVTQLNCRSCEGRCRPPLKKLFFYILYFKFKGNFSILINFPCFYKDNLHQFSPFSHHMII